MGVQAIEVDAKNGMLPREGLKIIVGKATNALKGLMVITGVVHFPTERIKVLLQSTKGIAQIKLQEPIAQILMLLKAQIDHRSQKIKFAALSMSLTDRPLWTLIIKEKSFQGLLDTGADVNIIAKNNCPPSWPLQPGDNTLVELLTATAPSPSAQVLQWKDQEENKDSVQPYVCTLPISLWGRDVLEQLGLTLTNNCQLEASPEWCIMQKIKYTGGGLGLEGKGIWDSIQPQGNKDRQDWVFHRGH